ncbi:MAG: type II secretion system secretin GspD [Deltaproteobacteria bacterium]|nr:type II secretion system secretin GspD [Deltaproteobacteria bacterium]
MNSFAQEEPPPPAEPVRAVTNNEEADTGRPVETAPDGPSPALEPPAEESAKTVEPVEPVEPAQPAQSAQSAQPTRPVANPALEEKYGPSEPATTPSTPSSAGQTPSMPPDAGVFPADVTGATDELIYLNATDVEIKDLIKQISKATGTNFLIDDKIKGKITIISEKPMTKDMAYQAFLSALEVMGYTTVMTPGGLVKVVDTKASITEPLEIFKDETPNTDKYVTRIVQVKNISANEISSVIKGLVSKDGNLFAYPSTNSLILTDSGSNIDRILKIIHELDQEGPQEVIQIIPIRYADSKDIAEKVSSLFEDASAKGKTTTARRSTARRGAETAAELEETPSISKVITDERTNSIIILGSKRSIIKVRALISQLDTPVGGVSGAIHVYYLKHANAKEMAEVLSSFVSGGKKTDKSKKTGTTATTGADTATAASSKESTAATAASLELTGEVKITADEGTNALVITASPKDYETLVELVLNKLDIPRRQVYLEAVVMELSVTKTKTIGFSGNMGNVFSMFGNDITSFGAILPTFPSTISSIAGASGGAAGGIASERTISFTDSSGATIEIPAVSAILQALQSDTDVNILSTPSILTLDNQEAEITVGNEVGVPGTTTISSGVSSTSVTREDTGISLIITPQVSESNTVRLEIEQEITGIVGAADPVLGPTFTKRSVKTVVVAHDKQTIVIGGLIDDTHTVGTNKVPLLGDIPVLGNLFKNRTTSKEKTNIIVFITPYIIRERADYLEILKKKIEERNLFIEMNYGAGQRKAIRESIKNHAKDLLEYKTAVRQSASDRQSVSTDATQYTPTTTTTSSTTEPATTTTTPTDDRIQYKQKSR